MAGRVGDDELALLSGEKAVRNVDRDALLAFGCKSVDQQRKVDFVALRPNLLAVGFKRGELVLEDHLGIVEQAPDQRRLAVIDAAASDEAEQALVLVLRQVGVDIFRDQRVDLEAGFGFNQREHKR